MKVHLATAADEQWSRVLRSEVAEVAQHDRFGEHELTSDPAAADVILFLDPHHHLGDWRQQALARHPLVRQYPEKAFVYDERDLPRDLLPGVYVGMPSRRFDPRRHRAFAYYHLVTDTRPVRDQDPDLLFSFQGRRIDALRDKVLGLDGARAVLEDTTELDFFGPESPALADARLRYLEAVGRSRFVLCPRGAGTSSLRLFEAMAAGRVPVVLSDDWVAPAGIDWSTCSIRIPEDEVDSVPRRLEALEDDWEHLGAAAAAAYDEWFAPSVWFHRVAGLCAELAELRQTGPRRQLTSPETWRAGRRHWRKRLAARRRASG